MTAIVEPHAARFHRVLDHVDAHLDDELTVERLSCVAGLSRFHFHRQFVERFGIGVHEYVRLVRLRRASYELAFRGRPILDIALASGYESHEAFSRAFKKAIGQTPSSFRAAPRWDPWLATQRRVGELQAVRAAHDPIPRVEVVWFEGTHVAALEHRGDADHIGASLRRFIAWRRQQDRSLRTSAVFNIVHDDPATTKADHRFDICAATDRPVKPNPFGVLTKTIPRSRCARLRHVGPDRTLGDAVRAVCEQWLPASGEARRDFPLFLRRVRLFPDVPEHEAVTEVLVPLR